MSGESARHIGLIEALIDMVERRHQVAGGLMVLADHRSFGNDRPPQIGGFTPDLFASDVPETFRVIGEAKTQHDLETDRSKRQLMAFLDHLCLYPSGTLYIAVPWFKAPRARVIVRSMRQPAHEAVAIEILSCP